MHIGCDLDGVIIDHRKNQKRLLQRHGFGIPLSDISKETIRRLLAGNEYQAFKREIYVRMCTRADEVVGAKEYLQKLVGRGHEVRIISRRPAGHDEARAWLKNHGFGRMFSEARIHFVDADEKKDAVCRTFHVELHIDDSPEVLQKISAPRYKILFSEKNRSCPFATHVVKNWHELFLFIKKLEVDDPRGSLYS